VQILPFKKANAESGTSVAGELQRLVDELPALLAPPKLNVSTLCETASRERRAKWDSRRAELEFGEAAKRMGPDHPEVAAARDRSVDARQRAEQAQKAYTDSIERRELTFAGAIGPKLDAAAPALLACAKLMNEAL
jgi:hypothetical protein